ncbi:Sulfur globule protein CV1 domain protein [Trichostrongylus colubriformis]|uniref:Sulfur globule protein CV1 domain protein n=1 Tax=Trichostrongylus colubriformis TaxID=6319 RepID=A0AAN8F1C5_TRICO
MSECCCSEEHKEVSIKGYTYGIGVPPPIGPGMGLGMDMLNNPYGYASYYNYRCRNLLGGGMYNPLMMGRKKK